MNPTFISSRLAAAILAAALAGCSMAPTYQRPEAPVPSTWNPSSADGPASAAATLDWQSFVTDDGLRRLVTLALDNNRDLRQALLNIEAARAQYRVQRADRLPGINAQGSGTRQRVPGDLNSSGSAGVQSNYQAGLGLTSFEIDLFGRVRSLSDAALQEYLATEASARSAQISLVAEVIQAYLARDSALRRLQVTRQTLESREASLDLTAKRRQAGSATALDYQEALAWPSRRGPTWSASTAKRARPAMRWRCWWAWATWGRSCPRAWPMARCWCRRSRRARRPNCSSGGPTSWPRSINCGRATPASAQRGRRSSRAFR